MENGIEKKVPKKLNFTKAPQRGRNVFGKFDPKRFEEEQKNFVSSFSKVKTPTVPVPDPSAAAAAAAAAAATAAATPTTPTPSPNLVQYPTVAYPSGAANPNANLVSYPVLGPSDPALAALPITARKDNGSERDAISEMFDL